MSISFLRAEPTVHEVNGEELNFYPLSLRVAFELRALSGPIATSLSTLFADNDGDRGWTKRTFAGEAGTAGEVTEAEAVPSDTIKYRRETKHAAIKEAFECLTDAKNGLIVGKIICDSLRENFDRGLDNKIVQAFINNPDLDILTLKELIVGVAQANKKVFGPLGDKVASIVEAAVETPEKKSTPSGISSTSPASSPSPSDSASTTSPTLTSAASIG